MTVSPTDDAIERRRTLALFLLFAGFYLLTASGHFYAVDEETLYHVTESVVERHTLALPEGAWGLVVSQQRTGDGRVYAIFPPGQALRPSGVREGHVLRPEAERRSTRKLDTCA